MAIKIGLWIDHRQTVIITITDEGADTKLIKSNVEKHLRAGDPTLKGSFKARQMTSIKESSMNTLKFTIIK